MVSDRFEVIEGIRCYAPLLARENSGFKEESFDQLYKLEEHNFWFEGRAKILKYLFQRHLSEDKPVKFLEIGCGTGFMLNRLSGLNKVSLTGSEIYLAGLHFAQKRLPETEFIQLDATNIPFEGEYDAIGAFDVLEHIEPDEQVMRQVWRALTKNGFFFITVPQYRFMWSYLDDYSCHKRRYNRKELRDKLRKQGFEIKYLGSFVFTLFPLMVFSRMMKKKDRQNTKAEYEIPRIINGFFLGLMHLDFLLIRLGVSLPFGGSLVCVARKH